MRLPAAVLLLLLSTTAWSTGEDSWPAIAIIVDDMGNHRVEGRAALRLPGALTYAFLPHTPYSAALAGQAHQMGKEVMLHLPMDAHQGNALGPGALTLHMTEQRFKRTLEQNILSIPHVRGLNNHMGSLLTRHPGAMAWVMQAMQARPDLYFVDSRTTHRTVAQETAQEYGIPNTRRDVFLDNEVNIQAITRQFRLLVKRARKQGAAVGICHPYPQTLAALKPLLTRLSEFKIRLISASEMIQLQRRDQWPASSSPSLKVVKNSKR